MNIYFYSKGFLWALLLLTVFACWAGYVQADHDAYFAEKRSSPGEISCWSAHDDVTLNVTVPRIDFIFPKHGSRVPWERDSAAKAWTEISLVVHRGHSDCIYRHEDAAELFVYVNGAQAYQNKDPWRMIKFTALGLDSTLKEDGLRVGFPHRVRVDLRDAGIIIQSASIEFDIVEYSKRRMMHMEELKALRLQVQKLRSQVQHAGAGERAMHKMAALDEKQMQEEEADAWGKPKACEWCSGGHSRLASEVDSDCDECAAWDMITRWQFPSKTIMTNEEAERHACVRRRFLIFAFDGSGRGLGSQLMLMARALSFAMAHNMTLVPRSHDKWNYVDATCVAGWSCYFKQISSCRQEDSWSAMSLPLSDSTLNSSHDVYFYDVSRPGPHCWSYSLSPSRLVDRFAVDQNVPSRFASRGLCWWLSQLLRFLLRPRQNVVREYQKYAEELQEQTQSDASMRGHASVAHHKEDSSIIGVRGLCQRVCGYLSAKERVVGLGTLPHVGLGTTSLTRANKTRAAVDAIAALMLQGNPDTPQKAFTAGGALSNCLCGDDQDKASVLLARKWRRHKLEGGTRSDAENEKEVDDKDTCWHTIAELV